MSYKQFWHTLVSLRKNTWEKKHLYLQEKTFNPNLKRLGRGWRLFVFLFGCMHGHAFLQLHSWRGLYLDLVTKSEGGQQYFTWTQTNLWITDHAAFAKVVSSTKSAQSNPELRLTVHQRFGPWVLIEELFKFKWRLLVRRNFATITGINLLFINLLSVLCVCMHDSKELLEKEPVSDADVGWLLGAISPPLL